MVENIGHIGAQGRGLPLERKPPAPAPVKLTLGNRVDNCYICDQPLEPGPDWSMYAFYHNHCIEQTRKDFEGIPWVIQNLLIRGGWYSRRAIAQTSDRDFIRYPNGIGPVKLKTIREVIPNDNQSKQPAL